jgi:hypothetical protein
MKIFLTYDYELFFGNDSGTVEKCMLEPTKDLFDIARGKAVYYTFFVDVGYLITAEKYPELNNDLERVKAQIKEMVHLGHEVQLHVHPHWEKSVYENGKWTMNVHGAYKLSDFSVAESAMIFNKYKAYLEELIGREVKVFRAGGWCIQPFEHIAEVFKTTGMVADSSVIIGDYMMTDDYAIDFRFAPLKSKYKFSNNVCIEEPDGDFCEFPIASLRYSPLFFWRLYILGRLFPSKHKMIGDGTFLSQGGRKKRVLTSYSIGHVSTDGYYASKLEAALEKNRNIGFEEMVVIGHPKGNTKYSLRKLKAFIEKYQNKNSFTTFDREL